MIAECREKADDTTRHPATGFHQCSMLRGRLPWNAIETGTHSCQPAFSNEPPELFTRDAMPGEVSWAHHTGSAHQP
jgi:hypothetical protein